MSLQRVRLEMGRSPEFPDGSNRNGYEFAAPLNDAGHLDADEWKKDRERCRVRRFWGDQPDEIGLLIHRPGGSWAFEYGNRKASDEAGFKFDKHRFVPGEYVSITEHDHVQRTFLVVSVQDLD